MTKIDAIVLGLGGVGSAALYHLANRGMKVLGIDQFHPPHSLGSTHGQTRVIRQAYFEHPDYVPLLTRSYQLWGELESTAGKKLFFECGLVEAGPEEGIVVPGVLQAAEQHQLEVEKLSGAEIEKRWPGLYVPEPLVGVYEPRAGYLMVEDCVEAHLSAARSKNAHTLFDEEVIGWESGESIEVRTKNNVYAAERLIFAAGSWAGHMLNGLGIDLEIRRKSMFWYPAEQQYSATNGFPAFLYEMPHDAGVFYGLPAHDSQGVKLCEHSGGQPLENPALLDREIDAAEQNRVEDFAKNCLPQLPMNLKEHAACMYTMSSDDHFILDFHPLHTNVCFAAGLSGHGFKFAPVLGEALASLAVDGTTELPMEFLKLDRFQM